VSEPLKTGAELDALVAEKVMGWRSDPHGMFWIGKGTHEDTRITPTECPDCLTEFPAWSPSTSITDGMEVLDHFGDVMKRLLHNKGMNGWECIIDYDHAAQADTAPLAICLAALKAVGYPVKQ